MKQVLKKIVNRFLFMLGYVPVKSTNDQLVYTNIFKTSNSKTALLSYIQGVFDKEETRNDRSHTNRYTSYIIAEVLKELGYNVDVINYDNEAAYNTAKYDLIIGLGAPLDYALLNRNGKHATKVIWFGTGCNPLYSNVVTLNRVSDFYSRHKKILFASSRYIKRDWPLQHQLSDWIILHGSSFARATYHTDNITCISAPVFISHNINRTNEDWEKAKNNYLWFGVGGLIHKGLDIVLESFETLKDCHLHICGNLENETLFFQHYKPLLDSSVNITYHGFVDVNSQAFEKILHKCAFVIFASASEGNSPSVITCMANGGLIPLVTKNADVDLNGYGIAIESLSVESVVQSVKQSQQLTLNQIKQQSIKVIEETHHKNTFTYFEKDFAEKLQAAIRKI